MYADVCVFAGKQLYTQNLNWLAGKAITTQTIHKLTTDRIQGFAFGPGHHCRDEDEHLGLFNLLQVRVDLCKAEEWQGILQ